MPVGALLRVGQCRDPIDDLPGRPVHVEPIRAGPFDGISSARRAMGVECVKPVEPAALAKLLAELKLQSA